MTRKAKTRACPSCGLGFLKGKYVWRLLGNGPVRQTVCQSCAKLAVPVLASDAQARCEACGDNLAVFCRGCIGSIIERQTGHGIVEALAKDTLARHKKRHAPKRKSGAEKRPKDATRKCVCGDWIIRGKEHWHNGCGP